MAERTNITWTEHTWNPWQGCHRISQGCKNCYMFTAKIRYGQDPNTVKRSAPATFRAPLKWKEPSMVFTCSWSDWFIEEADPWRDDAWDIIRRTPHLTYQILTKRPERIADHLPRDWGSGWKNCWLGVSLENQKEDWRVQELLHIPAAVRFLSVEPLLEAIDLTPWLVCGEIPDNYNAATDKRVFGCHEDDIELSIWQKVVDWVVVGAESGPSARPCEVAWIQNIAEQCKSANVPIFVKQDHGPRPGMQGRIPDDLWQLKEFPHAAS